MRPEQRDDSVNYVVWKLANVARAHLDARLREMGLTVAQMGAIGALHHNGSMSTADVSRELHLTPQNLSLIIAKLDQDGCVQRKPHQTHGRIKQLELTAHGRRRAERAIDHAIALDEIMTADFSDKERATLLALLHRCLNALAAAPVYAGRCPDGGAKRSATNPPSKPRRAERR